MQSGNILTCAGFSPRRKRRDAMQTTLAYLSAVLVAEQECLDNTPINFRDSESYETGENAVDALGEMLADVYSQSQQWYHYALS
jgi:hypothetical protein